LYRPEIFPGRRAVGKVIAENTELLIHVATNQYALMATDATELPKTPVAVYFEHGEDLPLAAQQVTIEAASLR
jgi:hypothetical protein